MKSCLPLISLAALAVAFGACTDRNSPTPASPASPPAPAKTEAAKAEPAATTAPAGTAAAVTPAPAKGMAAVFNDMLVDGSGQPVGVESLAKAKYVAVYFSAHWCPPCRSFTPKLVEFTNAHRKDGNFEVVLVSSDKDEAAMLGYITETKMPWAGVRKRGGKLAPEFGKDVTGIPHLRVYDAEGKIVIDTDYNAKVYPDTVLEKLRELIAVK